MEPLDFDSAKKGLMDALDKMSLFERDQKHLHQGKTSTLVPMLRSQKKRVKMYLGSKEELVKIEYIKNGE